jgi:hypothetical protein
MVLAMAVVLWGASGILWLALTCLLVLMAVRELFQMVSFIKARSHDAIFLQIVTTGDSEKYVFFHACVNVAWDITTILIMPLLTMALLTITLLTMTKLTLGCHYF